MGQRLDRTKKALLKHALGLPEAIEDHPWGETVAKVAKGKIFAFFGLDEPDDLGLYVKLPLSGGAALSEPWAEPANYGLGKSGWVMMRIRESQLPPLEVLTGWIDESYVAIAPKRCVKQMPGGEALCRDLAPPPRARRTTKALKSVRRKVARKPAKKKAAPAKKKIVAKKTARKVVRKKAVAKKTAKKVVRTKATSRKRGAVTPKSGVRAS